MAINKLMDKRGNILFDLSTDTAEVGDVVKGKIFHDKTGNTVVGTLDAVSTKEDAFRFYDYDGTLLHSYTLEEAYALTELPALPDHSDIDLKAEGWNYSLSDIKEVSELDIGAEYETADNITYLGVDFITANTSITLGLSSTGTFTIDWGDGTTDNTLKHTYTAVGQYEIKISCTSTYTISTYILGSQTINHNLVHFAKLSHQVTSISANAFYGCYALQSVVIPNSVTSIGDHAFYGCYALQSVVIPNSVTSIGAAAFQYCYALQSVVIPNSVTSIGANAFYYCYALQSVVIPNSVTSIGSSAFSGCYALQSVVIPNSVTSIGSSAFNNCYALQSVVIPNSVTSIGANAFYYCYALQSVVIPNSVTSIGSNAFGGCALDHMDLSALSKPLTISSTSTVGYSESSRTIYYVAKGTLDLYKEATNWSVIYAAGSIKEI